MKKSELKKLIRECINEVIPSGRDIEVNTSEEAYNYCIENGLVASGFDIEFDGEMYSVMAAGNNAENETVFWFKSKPEAQKFIDMFK